MELDSLKFVWRSLETRIAPVNSSEAIRALLQRRSGGIVAKMRRNLIGELILIMGTYTPTIIFYFLGFDGKLNTISWLMIGLLTILVIYFYRKNLLLKAMQCADSSLHTNLRQQISTLKKYIRFYIGAGTIMIPVMTILTWLVVRQQYPPSPGADLFYQISGTPWWQQPLTWFTLLIPVTAGIYFINKWYVNRLYGQHIRKLQELLREMEEE